MTVRRDGPDKDAKPSGVNPGYASLQIARALTTGKEHEDPATRERAKQKILQWEKVLENILSGSIDYGTRAPVEGVPGWATLEVVTGGFATGGLVASGPLQEHEKKVLEDLPGIRDGGERRALNAHFLTDTGLADLQGRLRTGHYDVSVPEEGALMVVAWLVEHGNAEEARNLLTELSPFFATLRFYPVLLDRPRPFGSRVHLQDVQTTLENLRGIRPNTRILAQKEAAVIWAPLHDRVVALFLETTRDGWPCRHYPDGWSERALTLLGEYAQARRKHTLCAKPQRAKRHGAQLREFLGRCAREPDSLSGREVGRIRLILNRYLEKRGSPDSPTCIEARRRQVSEVSAPTFHAIAAVVISRMESHRDSDGLDDISTFQQAVTGEEAARTGTPQGTSVPASIQRKVERCLNETVEILVERGLITSAEALAKVLPQMTSGLRAAGIVEPALRQLYAAIYRAFRRRRSLLLLNLERQIQIEELPWVAAVDRFRSESLSSRELSRQALEEIAILTLTSFPHAILPNKLVQELRALASGADLDIPLVGELAADIFMGKFSAAFLDSANQAADLLDGTLYARYFGIDYVAIRGLPHAKRQAIRKWPWRRKGTDTDAFAQHCAARAGVSLGSWDPATNGMIIEQQQIVTTQNLATLFVALNLTDVLRGQLGDMAERCFVWIFRRQQMKTHQPHARLIMLKNTAYAWRQMIFFLSLAPEPRVTDFLHWAREHIDRQPEEFRIRFRPILLGLMLAAGGDPVDGDSAVASGAVRFLGWRRS